MGDAKPRLIYFDLRGRAETARMLFGIKGVEYTDVRVASIEEAKAITTLPYSQLPVLTYGNLVLSQSNAINRFLARELGLYGKDSVELARVDEITEGVADLMQQFYIKARRLAAGGKDKEREAFIVSFKQEDLPHHLNALEGLLKRNTGGNNFFVGDGVTLADVFWFNSSLFLDKDLGGNMFAGHTLLAAHHARVAAIPGLADWLRRRPAQTVGSGRD